MTDTQKIIVNMVMELEQCSLEEYEHIKPILRAKAQGNPHLLAFLEKVFMVVENRQPKLLEMKESVAA